MRRSYRNVFHHASECLEHQNIDSHLSKTHTHTQPDMAKTLLKSYYVPQTSYTIPDFKLYTL